MNLLNTNIQKGLTSALGALFALDDQGVTVLDVEVDGGRPVLIVDREPPSAKPATIITRDFNGLRATLHAGEVNGCKVQWTTKAPMRSVA
jgi:hypothetical protein